jgi:flagellar biosynthesis/type III secretory pathway protein FliH
MRNKTDWMLSLSSEDAAMVDHFLQLEYDKGWEQGYDEGYSRGVDNGYDQGFEDARDDFL